MKRGGVVADFGALKFFGQQTLMKCTEDANDSDLVGAPHCIFYDVMSDRQLGLFSRDHLALIRSKLSEKSLVRNDSVWSEFSHAWSGVYDHFYR